MKNKLKKEFDKFAEYIWYFISKAIDQVVKEAYEKGYREGFLDGMNEFDDEPKKI